MKNIRVKKATTYVIAFLATIILVCFGMSYISNSNEKKSDSISTGIFSPNSNPVDFTKTPFENYYKYIDDMFLEKYNLSSMILDEKRHIIVTFSDDLSQKDVKLIKGTMDSLDDVFQIYENEDVLTVELNHGGFYDLFEIHKRETFENDSIQETVEIHLNY